MSGLDFDSTLALAAEQTVKQDPNVDCQEFTIERNPQPEEEQNDGY